LDEYVVAVNFDPTCVGTEKHFRSCSGFLANDLFAGNVHTEDVGIMCSEDVSLLSEYPTGTLS
jgi:hypothetical protein